jgi:hypothetical protein
MARFFAARTPQGAAPGATCGGCRHFCNEPLALEAASPGLAVLSSGFAAVRAQDGLCSALQRYVSVGSGCARHAALQDPAGHATA